MIFAKTGSFVPPPSLSADEIVGAVVITLLPLCFLAWILFLVSFERHGARQILVAFATGSLLGLLVGAVYAFFHWHSQTQEVGWPIGDMAIECFLRKPLPALSACLGLWVSWLSLLTFGKRADKMDREKDRPHF